MALIILILLSLSCVTAHMEMDWPYPLRSKYNPATPQNLIDYSMKAPLDATGSNFPCKGYQSNTPEDIVTTYSAGSKYNISLAGSASHGGGSCQLSLSYDNGKTFKVIKSMIGGCPLQNTYDFTIPSSAPAGDALFAWSWSNFEGNREFYMNCASVHVTATSANQVRDTTSFHDLPNIWVADLTSINSCRTDGPGGSLNAVYPHPGPDVVYGAGLSSSSPATAGNCEIPLANRQVLVPSFSYSPESSAVSIVVSSAAVAVSSTSAAPSTPSSTSALPSIVVTPANPIVAASSSLSTTAPSTLSMPGLTTIAFPSTLPVSNLSTTALASILSVPNLSATAALSTSLSTQGSLSSPSPSSNAQMSSYQASTSLSSLSTVTMTIDCPSTITMTMSPTQYPATYTISAPASACTGTSAICPCNIGYSCMVIGTCQWACMAMPATKSPSFTTSVRPSVTTSLSSRAQMQSSGGTAAPNAMTMSPLPTPSASGSSSAPASGTPGFADANNLRSYLPCTPGTFICTDQSTFYTCDQQSGSWSYESPRQVAAGMQCQPFLSSSGSTAQTGQQGNTPQGYYRNDQYVRGSG